MVKGSRSKKKQKKLKRVQREIQNDDTNGIPGQIGSAAVVMTAAVKPRRSEVIEQDFSQKL